MGIVTGIGDKSLNKNVIVPEIDADLNDYILNKNCIINGLEVIGNTLTAGMCVLKGYRGILENDETLNGETYIYGKFTLYFNDEIPDDFEILKTNTVPQDGTINPASINQAGINYLLLYTYTNGAYILNSELNTLAYPAHAYEADETDLVKSGAVIESGVTTPTPLDTNAHLTEPLRVANTEYVHNQIDEEIDYQTGSYDITVTSYGAVTKIGELTLKKKAKYCIGTMTFNFNSIAPAFLDPDYSPTYNWGQMESKFYPKTQSSILVKLVSMATSVSVERTYFLVISTTGQITISESTYNGSATGTKWGANTSHLSYETN